MAYHTRNLTVLVHSIKENRLYFCAHHSYSLIGLIAIKIYDLLIDI